MASRGAKVVMAARNADKNAAAVRGYLDAVIEEMRLYAERPRVRGRRPLW